MSPVNDKKKPNDLFRNILHELVPIAKSFITEIIQNGGQWDDALISSLPNEFTITLPQKNKIEKKPKKPKRPKKNKRKPSNLVIKKCTIESTPSLKQSGIKIANELLNQVFFLIIFLIK